MKKNSVNLSNAAELRRQAEEIAHEKAEQLSEDQAALSPEETRLAFHELRVHQIELEMQNEELRRTQTELEVSHARYLNLYDLAPVGYVTLGETGLILEANLTAANLLGVAHESLIRQPLTHFILPQDQDVYYLHRKRLFETGTPQVCDLRMLKKDGAVFWVNLAAVMQSADDTPVCCVVLSDVSARVKVEEALRDAMEMLELANRELERTLAHEQHLARIDGLTGLYNRRYFFELAEREFSAALRYQRALAILMFDMDDLKLVNDTFGHVGGDRLLVLVAQTAVAQIRTVDLLARYGGDEFVLLLPQTSAEQALPIAERIREQTAAMRVETDKGPYGVTLSIGIAEIRHARFPVPQVGREDMGDSGPRARQIADESVENVIQRADEALYTAKAEGRNRTVIYSAQMQDSE